MIKLGRQKRGKHKTLPPTQLYSFNFPVDMKEQLEDICWYERTDIAEKLRELIQEEISRKKGDGSKSPLANIEQNNPNKYSSKPTLDQYMRQVQCIEQSCQEDMELLNEQFLELKKLKTIAFHHGEQTRLFLELIRKAERKLCLTAKRTGLPDYNEWRDTSRKMGLSDEQIKEVLEETKKEGLKPKWET